MKLVKYILLLSIIFMTGCGSSADKDKLLKNKYNENFEYIGLIDVDTGWTKYHYKSKNGEDFVVSCKQSFCQDNYYKILKKDEIISLVDSKLKQININDYKYYVFNNTGYCDNRITALTKVEDAMKIDSNCNIANPIYLFIKQDDVIDKNDPVLAYFKDNNISLYIYKVSKSDYSLLSANSNGYIYDYVEENGISVGVNSKYALMPKTLVE